jgi:hypothetical protein
VQLVVRDSWFGEEILFALWKLPVARAVPLLDVGWLKGWMTWVAVQAAVVVLEGFRRSAKIKWQTQRGLAANGDWSSHCENS